MSKFELVIRPPGHVPLNTLGGGWFWTIQNAEGEIIANPTYTLSSKEECKADFDKFKDTFLQSFSK